MTALLTVDLHSATDKQRRDFNDALAARKWAKSTTVTTAWTASFKQGTTEPVALAETKKDVSEAATAAGITSRWDALVLFGVNAATPF